MLKVRSYFWNGTFALDMIKKIKKVYNNYFWVLFIIENPFSCCEENGVPVICIGLCMPEQENEEETSAPKIGGQCKTHFDVIHECKNKGQAQNIIQGKILSIWISMACV